MKILALNCWGGREHEALIGYLAKAECDVLCLQEIIHTPKADTGWMTYRDEGKELPQRARLYEEIRAALPGHTGTFCPAAQGDLWDGDTRYASQWGLATFIRNDIPMITQRQDFIHGEFSAHGYGNHPRSRNAHAVRLYDYGADKPITVVHLHGLRDVNGKHDTPERQAQAKRIAEVTTSVAGTGGPTIVCGDFNIMPESETFNVMGSIGLTELVTSRKFPGTRTSLYPKQGRFADYMFVSEDLRDTHFEVVRSPEVSDHCPLLLDTAI